MRLIKHLKYVKYLIHILIQLKIKLYSLYSTISILFYYFPSVCLLQLIIPTLPHSYLLFQFFVWRESIESLGSFRISVFFYQCFAWLQLVATHEVHDSVSNIKWIVIWVIIKLTNNNDVLDGCLSLSLWRKSMIGSFIFAIASSSNIFLISQLQSFIISSSTIVKLNKEWTKLLSNNYY